MAAPGVSEFGCIAAFYKLSDQIHDAVVCSAINELNDVGMLELRSDIISRRKQRIALSLTAHSGSNVLIATGRPDF